MFQVIMVLATKYVTPVGILSAGITLSLISRMQTVDMGKRGDVLI